MFTFTNPYVLLGLVVGVLVALVGSFSAGVRYEAGQNALATQDAKIQFDAKLAEANANARESERLSGIKMAQADTRYQEQINATSQALSTALKRTGNSGLFVRANCPTIGPSAVSGDSTSAGIGDGAQAVRLSAADGEFFIRFASQCDTNTDQLRAAQAVITSLTGSQ